MSGLDIVDCIIDTIEMGGVNKEELELFLNRDLCDEAILNLVEEGKDYKGLNDYRGIRLVTSSKEYECKNSNFYIKFIK
jgi:hypothetical protein